MAQSTPVLCAATGLSKLFEQLLEALDNGGFSIAGAYTDMARHAFEAERSRISHTTADGMGLLLPGTMAMLQDYRTQE
jgi:hypothetical protein